MSVFQFRPGRSIKGLNPQKVGEELELIRQQNNGIITAEIVLENAKDESSPLNQAFTWDDSEAAHAHRLNEARKLIISIQVFSPIVAKPVPTFVNVRTPDRGRGYTSTIETMSDNDLRQRVLLEIQQALESIQRKYASFAEIGEILSRVKQAAS